MIMHKIVESSQKRLTWARLIAFALAGALTATGLNTLVAREKLAALNLCKSDISGEATVILSAKSQKDLAVMLKALIVRLESIQTTEKKEETK